MSIWVAWVTVAISIVLLAALGVLLYRLVAGSARSEAAKEPVSRRYVPTTPDETMIISREQADDMLNK